MSYAQLLHALSDVGLIGRGAIRVRPEDGVPPLRNRRPAATLVLVGHAGPAMWRHFLAARERTRGAGPPLTLDDWSMMVLAPLATRFDAAALFPFTKPYLPFQRWAKRTEACHTSPLGMLIHPDFGLWHGYRGALAFAERLDLPPPDRRPSPCDDCPDRPCLTACPVSAFDTDQGYDVPRCAAHLKTRQGAETCMTGGCLARHACPVGREYAYPPAQAAFHMNAFLASRA